MPDYEFRCVPCSVIMVNNFSADAVPEEADMWCPRCKKTTNFIRIFGFSIPKGDNGEGFRPSTVRDL